MRARAASTSARSGIADAITLHVYHGFAALAGPSAATICQGRSAARECDRCGKRVTARELHTGPELARRLVLTHDVGADPAALGDLQARCPGPGPHSGVIDR